MKRNKTMAKKSKTLTTITFKIHPDHKAVIQAACEVESKKIARSYSVAEYFRDSALQFAAKDFTVPEHDYKRGRPLTTKAA